MIDCTFWTDCGLQNAGCCEHAGAVAKFGGTPSHGICRLACKLRQPRPEQPLQPVARQAANLAKAVVRTGAAAIKGQPVLANRQLRIQRLATCVSCPSSLYRASDQKCAHPECNCPVQRKARYATESCPLGHWPEAAAVPALAPGNPVFGGPQALALEAEIRGLLPTAGPTAAAYTAYHKALASNPACPSCTKSRLQGAIVQALVAEVRTLDKEKLRLAAELFSQYTLLDSRQPISFTELANQQV